MSTCTLFWSAWASAEGWWCLCCTSHICHAQLGFAVWQLREPQLHHFIPVEEGSWKEGDSGKSHTWQAGDCETLKQDAVCCLTGTNKSCPIAQGKRTGCWSGVSWSCWLSLFSGLQLWTCHWQCRLVLSLGMWQVHSESRRSRHRRIYPEIRTVLLGDSLTFYWAMSIKTWYKVHRSPGQTLSCIKCALAWVLTSCSLLHVSLPHQTSTSISLYCLEQPAAPAVHPSSHLRAAPCLLQVQPISPSPLKDSPHLWAQFERAADQPVNQQGLKIAFCKFKRSEIFV